MKKKNKKKNQEKRNRKIGYIRLIHVILILFWAIFVFGLSNQEGNESSNLSRKVAELIFNSEEIVKIAEPIIRKIAHFSEYSLGGFLFYSLFNTYEYTLKKKIIISLLLGVWYASLDETFQLFVPERSGNIKDVGIDTLGILFGIVCSVVFYKILLNIIKKIKERQIKKDSDQK